jgi:hypothetical protein
MTSLRITYAALVAAALTVSACVTSADQAAADRSAAMNSAIASCEAAHPRSVPRTRAAFARCIVDAERRILVGARYPDLIHLKHATYIALAEKVDAGEISGAEASRQFAELMTRINSEGHNRASVSVQSDAAIASVILANQPRPYMLPMPR